MQFSKRQIYATIVGITVATCVALLLPPVVAGWGPIYHFGCVLGTTPSEQTYAWIPGLMANSPFGGVVWANGTVPPGPLSPRGLGTGFEVETMNGRATWSGFRAEINVTKQSNETLIGPGSNKRCSEPYFVSIHYWGGIDLGFVLLGAGNESDANEPSTLGVWSDPGDINVSIDNGYSIQNAGNISTCGLSNSSTFSVSSHFDVAIPVDLARGAFSVVYSLPFVEQFHYIFPADFGVWQIDNLSAPGGPGGGWAFSYSACP